MYDLCIRPCLLPSRDDLHHWQVAGIITLLPGRRRACPRPGTPRRLHPQTSSHLPQDLPTTRRQRFKPSRQRGAPLRCCRRAGWHPRRHVVGWRTSGSRSTYVRASRSSVSACWGGSVRRRVRHAEHAPRRFAAAVAVLGSVDEAVAAVDAVNVEHADVRLITVSPWQRQCFSDSRPLRLRMSRPK